MALLQIGSSAARRTEPFRQPGRRDGVLPIASELNHLSKSRDVAGPPEGSQRHYLVFIRRMQTPEVPRDFFVKDAERVRHVHLLKALQAVALAQTVTGGPFFSPTIQGHH